MSTSNRLIWQTTAPPHHIAAQPTKPPSFEWHSSPNISISASDTTIVANPTTDNKEWRFFGIRYSECTFWGAKMICTEISYWYPITLLALVSAYLLFSNRGISKHGNFDESAPQIAM
jgi:hypothetical protein